MNADVVSPLAHGTSTLRLDGTSSSLAALAKTGKKEPENSKKDATKALVSAKGDVKNGGTAIPVPLRP
ncbi:hypothetical protein OZX57_04770 [Bifidobacterium sp. ESL0682]|uniref:hypothetical protein n=1 Tax=Bifidobacterium sp. ESL0682 TaxID=2983212 RepID=UPI0023F78A23|nr:hypothetical protein [Bifidobacterium sp. ESL0682]WEV41379.1 hypothetical protein OZX57_04770 [Bifidobacterium sp. ESL0682]